MFVTINFTLQPPRHPLLARVGCLLLMIGKTAVIVNLLHINNLQYQGVDFRLHAGLN